MHFTVVQDHQRMETVNTSESTFLLFLIPYYEKVKHNLLTFVNLATKKIQMLLYLRGMTQSTGK